MTEPMPTDDVNSLLIALTDSDLSDAVRYGAAQALSRIATDYCLMGNIRVGLDINYKIVRELSAIRRAWPSEYKVTSLTNKIQETIAGKLEQSAAFHFDLNKKLRAVHLYEDARTIYDILCDDIARFLYKSMKNDDMYQYYFKCLQARGQVHLLIGELRYKMQAELPLSCS